MIPLPQHSGWLQSTLIIGFILIFTGSALAASNDGRSFSILHPPSSPSPNGANIYNQWCSSCHGDRGQGLTADWRAQWPEEKQNCWQSKCHAGNHPPDGFSFPQNVPALIGPDTLTKFSTAQDLYAYARAAMPYWSPNLLSDDDYQAITLFLVEANYTQRGFPPPRVPSGNLAAISLHPETTAGKSSSQPAEESSPKVNQMAANAPGPATSLLTPVPQPLPPDTAASTGLSLIWVSPLVLGAVLLGFLARRFLSRSSR
jgi:mono/diheme cytochrome c family protein